MKTRGPRGLAIARGAIWNLAGQSLPVLAAIVCVPLLVRGLGVERFGILTLAWMMIGYFSLFDLGIGGALTRAIAECRAAGRDSEVPGLFWTSLAAAFALGALGGALTAGLAPWVAGSLLRVPGELRPETTTLLFILAGSLPVVTVTAALSGTLAGEQRFGLLNALRAPLGLFTYAGPLLVLPFSHSLAAVGIVLAAGRALAALAHLAACFHAVPGLASRIELRSKALGPLLSYGGWMTVSAVVGPVMVYFDRFVIGARLSMSMVAYYTTPYDLASRMWILSMPVVGALFPAFAATAALEPSRARKFHDWGMRAVAATLFPVAFVLATFAPGFLALWIGDEFALHGAGVLRILALGMFLNGLAQVSLSLIQAAGRPDLGARLHLIELPIYLLCLFPLVAARGIEGAALAWLIRVALDTIVLFILSGRTLAANAAERVRPFAIAIVAALPIVAGSLLPGRAERAVLSVCVLGVFAIAVWRGLWVPGRGVFAELLRSREGAA